MADYCRHLNQQIIKQRQYYAANSKTKKCKNILLETYSVKLLYNSINREIEVNFLTSPILCEILKKQTLSRISLGIQASAVLLQVHIYLTYFIIVFFTIKRKKNFCLSSLDRKNIFNQYFVLEILIKDIFSVQGGQTKYL